MSIIANALGSHLSNRSAHAMLADYIGKLRKTS
jgi:hypothetical protein